MKPIPANHLTNEDLAVEDFRHEGYWGFRSADMGRHLDICELSDRRDAALMLALVDLRSIGAYMEVQLLQECWGQDGYGFKLRTGECSPSYGKFTVIGPDITNFA